MASFGLGSNATGHLNGTLVWNSSTQVRYRLTLSVTVTGNAFHNGPGPTWSSSMGGHGQSGSWTYPGSGTRNYTLANYEVTFDKDVNGNITVGFSGIINGDNAPYVTSNGTSFNLSPPRIGIAPTMNAPTSSNVKTTTATISGSRANNGLGTSTTVYLRYRRVGDTSWITLPSGTNSISRDLTGLKPGTEYEFQVRGVNNNGDDSGYVHTRTFKTKPVGAFFARGFGL